MTPSDDADLGTIRAAAEAYHMAVQSLDVGAVSGAWAEDGIMWAPEAQDVHGREAIRALLASSYPHVEIEEFVFETRDFELRDDLAVESATYRERIRLGDQDPRDLNGRYILVWKRRGDGAWKIQRGIYNYSAGSVTHSEAAAAGA